MTLIISFLIYLPKIICGFAIVHFLWNKADFATLILKVVLGVPIGLAISSCLFFTSILFGVTPRMYSLVEFWCFFVLALLVCLHVLRKLSISTNLGDLSPKSYLSFAIIMSSLGLLIYSFLSYSKIHPFGFEDAWSIWNYIARFIYRTNSPNIFFNSQFFEVFHPDYPPGLSLNVAWGWLILNNETTRIPISVAFYTLVSPAFILWGAIKIWKGPINATLASTVYLTSANLIWSVGQLADTLISLYILSAVVMFYFHLRSSNYKILIIAGLLTGFSAWIKNEGILFIVTMLVIYSLMALKQTTHWKNIKWLSIGIFLPSILLVIYKLTIDVPSDLFKDNNSFIAQILDIQRWWTIGIKFLFYILRYANWPVSAILVLLIYIFLVGIDRSEYKRGTWLFLIIAGQFAGYFGIYLVTPHELDWHIYTSMERLISHIFPALIFWVFTITPSQYPISKKIGR